MQDFATQRCDLAIFQGCFTTARWGHMPLCAVSPTKQHMMSAFVRHNPGISQELGQEQNTQRNDVVPLSWHCLKACEAVLLVTHQCSYLCHIIQTVENILSCFLRLNPRLCLMIIWRLLKTGDRHWPELPYNQLWVMYHFQLVPYPALIRDHCVSLDWPDNIHTISATVILQLLCHKVIYLFFFTSEDPCNYGGSPKGLLHPPQHKA